MATRKEYAQAYSDHQYLWTEYRDPDMSDPRLQEIAERYGISETWLDQWR